MKTRARRDTREKMQASGGHRVYLAALLLHQEAVRENPALWMPWNNKELIPQEKP
jgi:hypothetical protein